MAEERNWNLINCLCYLYNAFAVYTDGDLDEANAATSSAADMPPRRGDRKRHSVTP